MKIGFLAAAAALAISSTAAQAVTHYVYDSSNFDPLDLNATNTGATLDDMVTDATAGSAVNTATNPPAFQSNFSGKLEVNGTTSPAGSDTHFYAIFDFDRAPLASDPLGLFDTSSSNVNGSFVGLEVGWVNAAGRDEIDDGDTAVSGVTAGNLISTGAGNGILDTLAEFDGLTKIFASISGPETISLVATWTGTQFTSGNEVDFDINAIPVPAGILLLGTAFAGAGFVSRRAKRKAA